MFELLIVPLFTPDITSSITAMWNAARTGAGTSRASSKATSTAMRDMSVLPRSGQIAPASSLRQRTFVPSHSRDVARAHRWDHARVGPRSGQRRATPTPSSTRVLAVRRIGRERRQLLGPERAHVHRDRALARDAGDRLEVALVGHPLPRAADARRVRVLLGERAPLHAEVALRDDVAPIAADREHAAVLDVDLDAAERV